VRLSGWVKKRLILDLVFLRSKWLIIKV